MKFLQMSNALLFLFPALFKAIVQDFPLIDATKFKEISFIQLSLGTQGEQGVHPPKGDEGQEARSLFFVGRIGGRFVVGVIDVAVGVGIIQGSVRVVGVVGDTIHRSGSH